LAADDAHLRTTAHGVNGADLCCGFVLATALCDPECRLCRRIS